jgi:1-deoxy-D-xylulose-5-phosphate reductoisomerase
MIIRFGAMESVFNLNKSISVKLPKIRNLIILGASGSVGRQTFELSMAEPDKFKIKAIVSGKNIEETIRQANLAKPDYIVMTNEDAAAAVREAVSCKVLWGPKGQDEVISLGYDIAISAIPGIDGLVSTFKAIANSKIVAFANKETIIYSGERLIKEARKYGTCIIPIDSEHNAIFQILDSIDQTRVDKITLTASGGALLNRVDMSNIKVEDVLKHPTWNMGKKITVDCATLVNKALEVIEARYLFGMGFDNIDIIIHPQSIIHGIVTIKDGSTIMAGGPPDMKIPISYGINWPKIGTFSNRLNLSQMGNLTFFEPDYERFPLFKLAINAAKAGDIERIIMNYGNELAVNLFLNGAVQFKDIYELVSFALDSKVQVESNSDNFFSYVKSICSLVEEKIIERVKNKYNS